MGHRAILIAMVGVLAARPAGAATLPPVRAWFEAGATFDQKVRGDHHDSGPAFALGVELGRRWGLLATVGYEGYAGHVGPYLQSLGAQTPPTAVVEGDTRMTAWTGSLGIRLGVPVGPLQGNIDLSLGAYNTFQRTPTYTDPTSGALYASSRTRTSSSPMSELGLTLRTHRGRMFDGFAGVRLRSYSQIGEAGASGSTLQARLGILSR